jgi:hypothetical protein
MALEQCPLRLLNEPNSLPRLHFGYGAMPPEDKSRLDIDCQLVGAGWIVQDTAEIDISAGPA